MNIYWKQKYLRFKLLYKLLLLFIRMDYANTCSEFSWHFPFRNSQLVLSTWLSHFRIKLKSKTGGTTEFHHETPLELSQLLLLTYRRMKFRIAAREITFPLKSLFWFALIFFYGNFGGVKIRRFGLIRFVKCNQESYNTHSYPIYNFASTQSRTCVTS